MTEILSRLNWHAGVQKEGPAGVPSISECSWLPNKKTASIDAAVSDVVAVLARVNVELNGAKPSTSTEKRSELPRQLVAAIERIRTMLGGAAMRANDPAEAAKFVRMEKRIAAGWDGILAGDIDDLIEYIDQQEWARQ